MLRYNGTGHNIISKRIRQLEMALPIDGSCDKELNFKGLDDLEIGDRIQIKNGEGGGLGEGRAGPMVTPLEEQDFELPEDGDDLAIEAASDDLKNTLDCNVQRLQVLAHSKACSQSLGARSLSSLAWEC